jgi:hypothetical protein
VNLGYLDPETINPADWPTEIENGVLMVPRAGELLFRVGHPPDLI